MENQRIIEKIKLLKEIIRKCNYGSLNYELDKWEQELKNNNNKEPYCIICWPWAVVISECKNHTNDERNQYKENINKLMKGIK